MTARESIPTTTHCFISLPSSSRARFEPNTLYEERLGGPLLLGDVSPTFVPGSRTCLVTRAYLLRRDNNGRCGILSMCASSSTTAISGATCTATSVSRLAIVGVTSPTGVLTRSVHAASRQRLYRRQGADAIGSQNTRAGSRSRGTRSRSASSLNAYR